MIDGIYLHNLIEAMRPLLLGARIDKVYHPQEKLLIFKINGQQGPFNKILISLDPAFCTIHLSTLTLVNPEQPSSFCMMLRKHLESGIIAKIEQKGYERIIDLHIESYNELGLKTIKILHLELMGKYSNVILTEKELILDALYKYPIGVNGFREILSKRMYQEPPLSNQRSINTLNGETLYQEFMKLESQDLSLLSFLQGILQGFSRKTLTNYLTAIGYEHVTIANFTPKDFDSVLKDLQNQISLHGLAQNNVLSDTDEAFNQYYTQNKVNGIKTRLGHIVARQVKKAQKKAMIYEDKIKEGESSGLLRIKGEILSANLYRLKENTSRVTLENYYEPELPLITIDLDKAYSPAVNVKRYFKKYHKLQEGKKQSEKLLADLWDEIDYYRTIEDSLKHTEEFQDLLEIQGELEGLGLIKAKSRKKKKEPALNLLKLNLEEGVIVYIGKNNRQNDYLTFKIANNNDYWFHVKNAPGAHILLNTGGTPLNEDLILKGAKFAVLYSGLKATGALVDYTAKKFVKRHPSHMPGKVLYTDYNTINIEGEDS